jgi:hypothetical protein
MKLDPHEIPGLAPARQGKDAEARRHAELLQAILEVGAELSRRRPPVVNVSPEIEVNVPPEPAPREWVFTVERDRQGFIQRIKATHG